MLGTYRVCIYILFWQSKEGVARKETLIYSFVDLFRKITFVYLLVCIPRFIYIYLLSEYTHQRKSATF